MANASINIGKQAASRAYNQGYEIDKEAIIRAMKRGYIPGLNKDADKCFNLGLELGSELGIEQGVKQGIREEKTKVILNLRKSGNSIRYIAKITDIHPKKVIRILKKNLSLK